MTSSVNKLDTYYTVREDGEIQIETCNVTSYQYTIPAP